MTQVRDGLPVAPGRPSLICVWSGGGRSDGGQGLIRKAWRPARVGGRAGRLRTLSLHTGVSLTLCRALHEEEAEGQLEFRAESSHCAGKPNCFRLSAHTPVPPRFLPGSSPSRLLVFLSLFLRLRFPLCLYSGSRGGPSCRAAWHRTMSEGKPSLSRMPRSLWQSSSSMKPYQ